MKNTLLKKSILSRIALFALVTMNSFSFGSSSEIICHMGKSFIEIERTLSEFLNPANNTAYATYVITFNRIITEFEKALENVTRATADVFTPEARDIANYYHQQFNGAVGVIKKYNGKNASDVANFKSDLDAVFNPDVAFTNIIKKLTVLKNKATALNDGELVKKITALISMIEKKRAEWKAKSNMVLFTGLTKRMAAR